MGGVTNKACCSNTVKFNDGRKPKKKRPIKKVGTNQDPD